MRSTDTLLFSDRLKLITGYSHFIDGLLAEATFGHLLTLMFNPLPGGVHAKLQQMRCATERVFQTYITRVVRKPNSPHWGHKRPVLIACPDLPVSKHEKQSLLDVSINDGWHIHGVLLTPAESRLRVSVEEHFSRMQHLYQRRVASLARIQAKLMDENTDEVVDYVFKNFKRGKVDGDAIMVLCE